MTKDLTGKRFGMLSVIKRSDERSNKKAYALWDCICDCGNKKTVPSMYLQNGHTTSCGCLSKESRRRISGFNVSKHPIYKKYQGMIYRCENKNARNYKNYGGRGISICDEWRNDFMSFYNWSINHGYKKGLTIDRIDVDGNYTPDNCRWVDNNVQANNKTNSRFLECDGKTLTVAQWSKETGISQGTINTRINALGRSVEDALKTPVLDHSFVNLKQYKDSLQNVT